MEVWGIDAKGRGNLTYCLLVSCPLLHPLQTRTKGLDTFTNGFLRRTQGDGDHKASFVIRAENETTGPRIPANQNTTQGRVFDEEFGCHHCTKVQTFRQSDKEKNLFSHIFARLMVCFSTFFCTFARKIKQ